MNLLGNIIVLCIQEEEMGPVSRWLVLIMAGEVGNLGTEHLGFIHSTYTMFTELTQFQALGTQPSTRQTRFSPYGNSFLMGEQQ